MDRRIRLTRHPSAAGATIVGVFVARLICSDMECAEEGMAEAAQLSELEALLCDCGCTLHVIAWPDWVDEPAEVVALRFDGPALRSAA
jgi:hypothetical protein